MKLFPLNLRMLSKITGGKLMRGNPDNPVHGAVYGQTKYMKPGVAFFMRLSDKAAYQLSAMKTRRSTVVITTSAFAAKVPAHHAVLTVSNPYHAYWRLARWQREKSHAFFIGITGSAGKTTTKEMLSSVLMRKYTTLKSAGNMNVFSSLPSHLCRLNGRYGMVVLEMGMANFGNIRAQCSVVRPKLGIVTNVGEAHAGKLGSSLKGVVKAKQELVDGIAPGGTLIINADDKGSQKLNTSRFRGRIIRYGIKNAADIRGHNVKFQPTGMTFKVGSTSYRIPGLGKHNVYNALAVIAAARVLGLSEHAIQQGLSTYERPYRRLQPLSGIKKFLLINDTFNANPSSAIEGLRVLKRLAKKRPKVAVIGDMLALGGLTKNGHRRVGRIAAKVGVNHLVTVGIRAREVANAAKNKGLKPSNVHSFANMQQAHMFLKNRIPANSVLYFKASHDTGLNQLVKALMPK